MSDGGPACCPGSLGQAPHGGWLAAVDAVPPASDAVRRRVLEGLVTIPGGFFNYGARRSTRPADLDAPRMRLKMRPFQIAPTAVTNDAFAEFVADTGYVTVAEREGWSFVFHLLLARPEAWPESPPGLGWWRKVDGACWRRPDGPDSALDGRGDHPVVHVCWYDALAFCRWSGARLPSEAEWEYAARGGLACKKFPWGNALAPEGRHAMNIWQGRFPDHNTAEDGHVGTAPVDAFKPNGYGLYNTTGNVWEWVLDRFGPRDGFQPKAGDPIIDGASGGRRVQRGGSYLCHESYCDRYHVHSRTSNDADSATGNSGFRIASSSDGIAQSQAQDPGRGSESRLLDR